MVFEGVSGMVGGMSGYAALTRLWTPPVLRARVLDDKGVDGPRSVGLGEGGGVAGRRVI